MSWYDAVKPQFVKNVANAYFQKNPFAGFDVFPMLPSNTLTGYIAKYTKEDWMRLGTFNDYVISGASETPGDDFGISSSPYTLIHIGFHKDVSEDDRNEYDNPFDPVFDATLFTTSRLQRLMFKKFTDTFFASGVWGSSLVGTTDFTKWSDSGATPASDIDTWKSSVQKITGFRPNRLVVSQDVHDALKQCPAILSAMKTTDDKVVTTGLLARLFELEKYVVVSDVLTTAAKGGTATSSNSSFYISGKALLVYAPSRASKFEPSAGYHVTYTKKGESVFPRTIPMPAKNNSLRVESHMWALPKVMAADLGIYASSVI